MVSPRSAAVALTAMRTARDRYWKRYGDASPLPPPFQAAWAELYAVAFGGDAAGGQEAMPSRPEEIGVAEAAKRLGVTPRAVRARLAAGTLSGRKLGRQWIISWRDPGEMAATSRPVGARDVA